MKQLIASAFLALVFCACNDPHSSDPNLSFDAHQVTEQGDTINRLNEKGKQGRWVYTGPDGASTDTIYKDGVPQL